MSSYTSGLSGSSPTSYFDTTIRPSFSLTGSQYQPGSMFANSGYSLAGTYAPTTTTYQPTYQVVDPAWSTRVMAAEIMANQRNQATASELAEAHRVLEAERRLRVNLQQELSHYYGEHSKDRLALEDLRSYAQQAVQQVRHLAERNDALQAALANLAAAQVPVHVPVDRPVYQEVVVERPIDRPVYQEVVVEKHVPVDRHVIKEVIVEKPVMKEVYVPIAVSQPAPPPPPQFGGVGLQLQDDANMVEFNVKSIVPGGPADRSGVIAVGDKVIGVDIYTVRDRPLSVVADYIRGPVGTTVRLHIRGGPNSSRPGEYFEVTLERYVEPSGAIVYYGGYNGSSSPSSSLSNITSQYANAVYSQPTAASPSLFNASWLPQQQQFTSYYPAPVVGTSQIPTSQIPTSQLIGQQQTTQLNTSLASRASPGLASAYYAGFPVVDSAGFGPFSPASSTGQGRNSTQLGSLLPMPPSRGTAGIQTAAPVGSTRIVGERWLGPDDHISNNTGSIVTVRP